MIILTYSAKHSDRTTVIGVFSSKETANAAIQEFLAAYKKQEIEMYGYWDETDNSTLTQYSDDFRMIPAELDQIVDRRVGFVYDWLL
jgi:hypothetical protein